MTASPNIKYTFSGHDSFQCRQLWLKKGFDFAEAGRSFNEESAVVELGVGKNMVSSIRFWLKAFNITGANDVPTAFGRRLLADDGWDPYLEDETSLWLLHYQLVKSGVASTYSLIFNEFRRERIEFTKAHYVDFVKRKSEVERGINFNQNTVASDFEVFRKMYFPSRDEKSIEDGFAGLLSGLGIISVIQKERESATSAKAKERVDAFYIDNIERSSVPTEAVLFSILDNPSYGDSISLNNLSTDINGPGAIFGLSKPGIFSKIDPLVRQKMYSMSFSDHAGINELQFKVKPDPLTILESYYGN